MVMGMLSAIAAIVLQYCLGASVFSWPTVAAIIIVFFGTVILTYLINLIRAPFIIDKGLRRDIGMLLSEWEQRMNIVSTLYTDKAEGSRLANLCRNLDYPNLKELITQWNKVTASDLTNIGEGYRREYFEDSRTYEYLPTVPDDPKKWQDWIRDRVEKLNRFIVEFKQPPQLNSHKVVKQIESGATKYPEIGKW